jgi:hypothetical protein
LLRTHQINSLPEQAQRREPLVLQQALQLSLPVLLSSRVLPSLVLPSLVLPWEQTQPFSQQLLSSQLPLSSQQLLPLAQPSWQALLS